MLSVTFFAMLNVTMLSVIMLSVVKVNAMLLSVVAHMHLTLNKTL
jgi:hypothetical protein